MKEKNPRRVAAGKAGVGVKRKFSAEELQRRWDRFKAFQHLGALAVSRRASEKRLKLEAKRAELKRLVESCASVGVFVEVQSWE